MCVIINKPARIALPKIVLRNSFKTNKQGFGLMYVNDGRVQAIKGLFPFPTILYLLRKHQKQAYVAHFRYTTAGETNVENCHPFQILDKAVHGMDLWMVHNGTLTDLPVKDGMSDTYQFAKILRDRVEAGLDIMDPTVQDYLADEIAPSKMVFLTDSGKTITLNNDLGAVIDNVWYSNMYSVVHPKHPVTLMVDQMLRDGEFHVRDYDNKWKEIYKDWLDFINN